MLNKRLSMLMVLVIVFTSLFSVTHSAVSAQTLSERIEGDKTETIVKETIVHYSEFLAQYDTKDRYAGEDIPVNIESYTFLGDAPVVTEKGILQTEATTSLSFEAHVPSNGLYQIVIGYNSPENERSLPAIRGIKINGVQQFDESERVKFPRFYVDATEPYVNAIGDEVRPTQKEVYM